MAPTRVPRSSKAAASREDVDRIGRMTSGYANTRLSGRQFNGEVAGSGTETTHPPAVVTQRYWKGGFWKKKWEKECRWTLDFPLQVSVAQRLESGRALSKLKCASERGKSLERLNDLNEFGEVGSVESLERSRIV